MANRFLVQCVGDREQFWSAGRKWTREGKIVTVVADDPIPPEFLRDKRDRFGKIVQKLDEYGEPVFKRRLDDKGKPIAKRDSKGNPTQEYETLLDRNGQPVPDPVQEFDFPDKDHAMTEWIREKRIEHDKRGEITIADYRQLCNDRPRFLTLSEPGTITDPDELERSFAQKRQ